MHPYELAEPNLYLKMKEDSNVAGQIIFEQKSRLVQTSDEPDESK